MSEPANKKHANLAMIFVAGGVVLGVGLVIPIFDSFMQKSSPSLPGDSAEEASEGGATASDAGSVDGAMSEASIELASTSASSTAVLLVDDAMVLTSSATFTASSETAPYVVASASRSATASAAPARASGYFFTAKEQQDCQDLVRVWSCERVVKASNASSADKKSALESEGRYFYRARNYTEAIASYNQAIQYGSDANSFYNRGLAYYYRGGPSDYSAAIADFGNSVRRVPSVNGYNMWGNAYISRNGSGDVTNAINAYGWALSLKKDAGLFTNRAAAYLQRGQGDDLTNAIKDCDDAVELQDDYARAYFIRGKARQKSGAMSAGGTDIAYAKSLDPYIK